MVYNWEEKRDECFDMYINQNRSLEEIMDIYREQNFTPSKRSFQAHFRNWNFPPKHIPVSKDADLAARIRELWEGNNSNKQILNTLKEEGHNVRERELTKIRRRHGLMMREANRQPPRSKKRKLNSDASGGSPYTDEHLEENLPAGGQEEERSRESSSSPSLPPKVLAKRQLRQAKLLAESEERLQSRSRRRRTRGWSGLPPDPAAPPRYPSELTMEESRILLGVDISSYKEMRDTFMEICQANDVVKKTIAGVDAWKAVKEELIRRIPHLRSIFSAPSASTLDPTREPMALDLICMDVTKKIRTTGNHITITNAKNTLGITPQEGRDIRSAFAAILKADHFTSKLEVSQQYWENLKAKWIEESPLLQTVLQQGETDLDHAAKLKSLESIASDVQKRHRDEQTKKDPTRIYRRKNSSIELAQETQYPTAATANDSAPAIANQDSLQSPSERQTNGHIDIDGRRANNLSSNSVNKNNIAANVSSNRANNHLTMASGITNLASQALVSSPYPGLQIDPMLLEAVSTPFQPQHTQHQTSNHRHPNNTTRSPAPKPIYFRLSALSQFKYTSIPKIWLDTLHAPFTIATLRSLALPKAATNGQMRVSKIEAVIGAVDEGGSRWDIDEDDELEAYLEHVGGGKATFIIDLVSERGGH